MNPSEFSPMDARLEQAVDEIRDTAPAAAALEAAADRVWTRLAITEPSRPEHLRSCADFQALLPEYRAGRLGEARAALLEDHLHECVACRKSSLRSRDQGSGIRDRGPETGLWRPHAGR